MGPTPISSMVNELILSVTLEKEKGLDLDPVPWCHACPSGMFSNGFLSGQACRTEVS